MKYLKPYNENHDLDKKDFYDVSDVFQEYVDEYFMTKLSDVNMNSLKKIAEYWHPNGNPNLISFLDNKITTKSIYYNQSVDWYSAQKKKRRSNIKIEIICFFKHDPLIELEKHMNEFSKRLKKMGYDVIINTNRDGNGYSNSIIIYVYPGKRINEELSQLDQNDIDDIREIFQEIIDDHNMEEEKMITLGEIPSQSLNDGTAKECGRIFYEFTKWNNFIKIDIISFTQRSPFRNLYHDIDSMVERLYKMGFDAILDYWQHSRIINDYL